MQAGPRGTGRRGLDEAINWSFVGEAEAALAGDPKYSDPAARTKAATAAFDTQDEIQHAMGEGRVLYEGE